MKNWINIRIVMIKDMIWTLSNAIIMLYFSYNSFAFTPCNFITKISSFSSNSEILPFKDFPLEPEILVSGVLFEIETGRASIEELCTIGWAEKSLNSTVMFSRFAKYSSSMMISLDWVSYRTFFEFGTICCSEKLKVRWLAQSINWKLGWEGARVNENLHLLVP